VYAAIAKIDREQRTVARYGNRDGMLELAWATPLAAEAGEKGAVRGKLLNPMVVEVGGEDISFPVDRYPGHGGEPAIEPMSST
jgi:hypothetical protein